MNASEEQAKTVRLAIRVDPDTANALRWLVRRRGENRSVVLRDLIRAAAPEVSETVRPRASRVA